MRSGKRMSQTKHLTIGDQGQRFRRNGERTCLPGQHPFGNGQGSVRPQTCSVLTFLAAVRIASISAARQIGKVTRLLPSRRDAVWQFPTELCGSRLSALSSISLPMSLFVRREMVTEAEPFGSCSIGIAPATCMQLNTSGNLM